MADSVRSAWHHSDAKGEKKGTGKMKNQELFAGFDPQQQSRHEQYLIDRFGDKARDGIAQSKARIKDWTRPKWEKVGAAFNQICQELVSAMDRKRHSVRHLAGSLHGLVP